MIRPHTPNSPADRFLHAIREEMMLVCQEYYLMGRTDALIAHTVKQDDPMSEMYDPTVLAERIALLGAQLARTRETEIQNHPSPDGAKPAALRLENVPHFHYPSFFNDHHRTAKGYPIRSVKRAIEAMFDETEHLREHPDLQRRVRISDLEFAMVAQIEYMRGVLEGLYIEGGMESPYLGPELPRSKDYRRRLTLIADAHLFARLLEWELGARPEQIVRYQTIHPRFMFAWSENGVQVLEVRDEGEDEPPTEGFIDLLDDEDDE